ncbi:MAG: hypothetical protein ACYC1C_09460 [Chloroflexota bacterium]
MERREMSLRLRLLITLLSVGTIFAVVCPTSAFAYLDPGTSSYVVQMLVAGLLGGAVALKMFWRNVRLYLTNLMSRGQQPGGKGVGEE